MTVTAFGDPAPEPALNRNEILRAALRAIHKGETMLDQADPRDEDDNRLSLAIGCATLASSYLDVANAISRPMADFRTNSDQN